MLLEAHHLHPYLFLCCTFRDAGLGGGTSHRARRQSTRRKGKGGKGHNSSKEARSCRHKHKGAEGRKEYHSTLHEEKL